MAEENSNVVADAAKSEANTQARRVVRAKAGKMISKGAGALTKNVTSKVATQAAKAVAGLASGGASLAAQAGLAAIANADKIVKNAAGLAGALTTLVGSGISAAAPTAFTQTAIAFVAVPITVAFFLVIINTGAYIVPPGDLVGIIQQPSIDPGLDIDSTCPIPDGVISVPAYESSDWGHGSNTYWNAIGGSCNDFRIPSFPGCTSTPSDPTSICYDPSSSCPFYGYATDVVYPNQGSYGASEALAVYLPYIGGNTVTWTPGSSSGFTSGTGAWGTLVANTTEGLFEIRFLHLSAPPMPGNSGDVTGTLYNGLGSNRHLHIELRINTEYVKPDFLCN